MTVDFSLLIPEFILAGTAFLVLLIDMLVPASQAQRRNAITAVTALVGLFIFFVVAVGTQRDTNTFIYQQLIYIDRYSLIFKTLFAGTGFAVVLMSIDYVGKKMRHPGEYYALIVFAVLGATLMSQAGEMLTAFISIELLAFSLYVLVGLSRGDARTAEASTKYILLGGISSAVMLYGMSLLYGVLGTTRFADMESRLGAGDWDLTLILGFVLFMGGLGFKLSMVPFHMWAPDVYEGAPTPITALIAVLSKAAALALTLRFLAIAASNAIDEWRMPLAILAAATITIGTLSALPQHNIKRLLAYSSISQVGFVLVGIIPMTLLAADSVVLHLVGYAFTNLAAFTVIIAIETNSGKEAIADYAGLAKRSPWLAMILTGALFSLAGLPIFAGFITKFYLFVAAVDQQLLWLVCIAVINSVISLYYYLRVIREMYVTESDHTAKLPVPRLTTATASVLFLGMILVGVYPGPLLDAISASTRVLAPFLGG